MVRERSGAISNCYKSATIRASALFSVTACRRARLSSCLIKSIGLLLAMSCRSGDTAADDDWAAKGLSDICGGSSGVFAAMAQQIRPRPAAAAMNDDDDNVDSWSCIVDDENEPQQQQQQRRPTRSHRGGATDLQQQRQKPPAIATVNDDIDSWSSCNVDEQSQQDRSNRSRRRVSSSPRSTIQPLAEQQQQQQQQQRYDDNDDCSSEFTTAELTAAKAENSRKRAAVNGGCGGGGDKAPVAKKPTTTTTTVEWDDSIGDKDLIAATAMCDMWNSLIRTEPDQSDMLEMDVMFETDNVTHSLAGAMDGYNLRSVYALLSRFDPNKCADEYKNARLPNGMDRIKRITEWMLWRLWRLGRFARQHDLDINLPDYCWSELDSQFASSTQIDNARPNNESPVISVANANDLSRVDRRVRLLEDDDVDKADTPRVLAHFRRLIGKLDKGVQELVLRLMQVRGAKFFEDLRTERLTALNFLDAENKFCYNRYAMTRMRHLPEREGTAYMNGFYLISLKPVLNRPKLEWPVYEDRLGYLPEIAMRFFHEKVRRKSESLPDNVRVFVNVATTKNCSDFNVLAPLPENIMTVIEREDNALERSGTVVGARTGRSDVGGVLGLVHFGHVKFDEKKLIVNIRGYLVATYSASRSA